jgi:hypothetical protein
LAITRPKSIAVALAADVEKMTPAAQEVSHVINEQCLRRLDDAANDLTNASSVDAQTLSSSETQFLTNLQDHIAFMFICRQPDCLFFGLNSEWVQHKDKHRFKCPLCGERYKPHSTAKNQIAKLGFVLQIADPDTGGVQLIPTVWPPNEETNWLNNQIELHARNIQTAEDAKDWHNKCKIELKNLIDRQKIPQGLQRMIPNETIKNRFSGKWKWEEFKEKCCFYGNQFAKLDEAREPYDNFNELIGLVANVLASPKAVARS